MSLPFSAAADRNKEAIGDALQPWLTDATTVFEFGSGTGQHALYLCQRYPHLMWQPSDLADNLDAIAQRTSDHGNILAPVECDVLDDDWVSGDSSFGKDAFENGSSENSSRENSYGVNSRVSPVQFSLIFSANTAHIMSVDAVANMITRAAVLLQSGGCFALYGPFRYGSQPMTEGNSRFDTMLRQQDAAMGIRDKLELDRLAQASGLAAVDDLSMPSNNRTLIWQKTG